MISFKPINVYPDRLGGYNLKEKYVITKIDESYDEDDYEVGQIYTPISERNLVCGKNGYSCELVLLELYETPLYQAIYGGLDD